MLNRNVVHLQPTQYCRSTILKLKKQMTTLKNNFNENNIQFTVQESKIFVLGKVKNVRY